MQLALPVSQDNLGALVSNLDRDTLTEREVQGPFETAMKGIRH